MSGAIGETVLRDKRRRILELFAAVAVNPLLALPLGVRAAAAPQHLRFRALRNGSPIGVHTVSFRQDGARLVVTTRIDISVKVLFFTAFHLEHEAEEVWQAGRLVAVRSATDDNGTRPESVAYEITKALFDNIDDFRRLHPDFATLVPPDMVPNAGDVPLHAGAARYYRARGWLP